MKLQIIQSSSAQLWELPVIKSFLRVQGKEEDELLLQLLATASEWVENQLERTLLKKVLLVSHENHTVPLPYGPVIRVLEVKKKGKVLQEKEGDYEVVPLGGSVLVKSPFSWRNTKMEVKYEAGFGEKAEDVPASLRHAVLGTVGYLYHNRSRLNEKELYEQAHPWLLTHRSYKLG